MAMSKKRYWWAKLFSNFFDRLEVRQLRARPSINGDLVLVVCLKIQLYCMNNDGVIAYRGICSTIAEEIALQICEDVNIVTDAITWLENMGWAKKCENGYDINFLEYGSESDSAERQRRRRERLKLESDNPNIHKALQCHDTRCDIVTTEDNKRTTEDERGQQQDVVVEGLVDLSEEDAAAIIKKYKVAKIVTLLQREGYDAECITDALLVLSDEGDNVINPAAFLRCAVRDGYKRNPAKAIKAAARQENMRLREEINEQMKQSGRRSDDDEQPSGDYALADEVAEIIRSKEK